MEETKQPKETQLKDLKNLGAASINILHAVGVRSLGDLQEAGSVKTYLKIKQRGIRVSKVMLYALEGALLNTHWKQLDDATKSRLLTAVEQLEQAQAQQQPATETDN